MSVFDATALGLAAGGPPATPPPPAPSGGTPPAGDKDKGGKEAEGRPATSDAISAILEKHGLESPDQLGEFIDNLASLKGKLGDADLDQILENHKTLEKYRSEWARQEREKLEAEETPEQTIARLKKEADDREAAIEKDRRKAKSAERAKQAIADFEATVTSAIKGDESIPQEYRSFVSALAGVKNPMVDVDITDKAAVKKAFKELAKLIPTIEQTVISRYRAGKIEIVAPPPAGSGDPPVQAGTGPKNLTESRRLAHSAFANLFRRG